MSEERIQLLEELREAANQLASYASYAEIVGGINVNRDTIRKHCDQVTEINHRIKHMDENKYFKVQYREDKVLNAKEQAVNGNVYHFTFGWDEGDETEWWPSDDSYPENGPRSILSGDLTEPSSNN